jgi:hypothetical protein
MYLIEKTTLNFKKLQNYEIIPSFLLLSNFKYLYHGYNNKV